jgi:general secretion pathway protein A
MYRTFYGLKEKPFSIVPNPGVLYLSSRHRTALTYLEYGLMEDAGFILLTGEIGTGKTTLIRHILNGLDSHIHPAVIFNTNVPSDEILNLVLQSLDLPREESGKGRALDSLYRFLIRKYAEKRRVLLIVDEAQNLSPEALEEVRMLSNLQSDDQILLQIMLVGQPELRATLRQPGLSSFTQRIAVNYHLSALSREEAGEYIAFRLEKAGGSPDIFTPEVVDIICRASGGIPRSINLLCDAALVYGFGYELKTIHRPVIDQVLADKGGMGLEPDTGDQAPLPTEEPPPETGSPDPTLAYRLRTLEATVQGLAARVEWQAGELERRAEGFKDDLVQKLGSLLRVERKRNDLLLAKYAGLAEKYKALQKRLPKNKTGPRVRPTPLYPRAQAKP